MPVVTKLSPKFEHLNYKLKNSMLKASLIIGFTLPCISFAVQTENTSKNSVGVVKTEGKSIYPASFFDQYLPQNALEMIERLPGFNFDQGANNRGFGSNAGNVLIDGARPTSKSSGLSGALIRITAAQVERIEILRGGVSAGETSGQSVVANVIRKKEGTSGRWAAKLRRAPDGEIQPNIEAAVNTQLGNWKSAFDIDIGAGPGYRTAIIEERDEVGGLISASDETFTNKGLFMFANGEGSTQAAEGKLTLNGRIGRDVWQGDTLRETFNARQPDGGSPDETFEIDQKNRYKVVELGVDWARSKDNWKWHMLSLAVAEKKHSVFEVQIVDSVTPSESILNFENKGLKTESIFRNTYGYVGSEKFKPEYGFEITRNKLDVESTFIDNGTAEPTDKTIVEELRAEIFASFVYQVNNKLSIEGGLTSEFSEIEVTGVRQNKQNFEFYKPRLSMNYKFDKDNQLTLEAERRVGQLNFFDFAASTSAEDNTSTSGNADLAPNVTDELAVTYDWSFSEKGSIKSRVFYEWQSDILEQVELTGGQGTGNAGDARFWGVITDINLPLDWVLDNGLIEISHVYRGSRFYDSIISDYRIVNGYTPLWLSFKLRQDLVEEKVAWGVEYWGDFTDTYYRVDERQTFNGNGRWRVFVETSQFFDLKTQIEITHLNTGEYTRSRFLYNGDRSGGFTGSEVAYRQQEPEIKFSIWGTF